MIKILTFPVSKLGMMCGGVIDDFSETQSSELNKILAELETKNTIQDVKVNHFTSCHHNNGGYDEVWVQYTVLYHSKELDL